jgi:hypothetical protein
VPSFITERFTAITPNSYVPEMSGTLTFFLAAGTAYYASSDRCNGELDCAG